MHCERRVGRAHDLGGSLFGGRRLHAVALVHRRQFCLLGGGIDHQFSSLDEQLTMDQFVLRRDRDPLASAHADGAGDGPGKSGESDNAGADAAAGKADDQRHVRDQPIAETEDRGAGEAASDRSVTRVRFGLSSERVAGHWA